MPFPFTVTISVSTTVVLGPTNVNVIDPVGALPPDKVAESAKVVGEGPSVALVGLGIVVNAGLAGLTTTCSPGSLLSVTSALFESPE